MALFKTWFSLRLHIQLALASGLLLAVTISVAAWFNIESQQQKLIDDSLRDGVSLASYLSKFGSYLVITGKLDELEELLLQSTSFPNVSMTRVIDTEGKTLSHVRKLESGEIIAVFDPLVVEIPPNKNYRRVTHLNWDEKNLVIWEPVTTSTLIGWIKMRISLQGVVELHQQAIIDNIKGAVIAIVIDMFTLLAILYFPAKSFRKVVEFASSMTDKAGAQIDFPGGSYEINKLIDALNSSSAKLALQRDELQKKEHGLIKLNETLELRVTQRTEALEKSNESLRLFNNAVEQNPNVIFIMNVDGIVEYVNPAFISITGYGVDAVLGKTFAELLSDKVSNEFYQEVWDTINTGKTWSGLIRNKKSNGEYYWDQTQVSSIKNEQLEITHFLSIQFDVTDKRQMEEQLLHSQKMDALGKLTGGVAHDYNNLLGIIMGYAEMLNERCDDPRLAKFAHEIQRAAERGTKLTRKLLTFSKQKIGDVTTVDLNELFLTQRLMLEKTLTARIKLSYDLDDNLWQVDVDSGDMEDCVINLSINALHAMQAGGELSIQTRNVKMNAEHAKQLQLQLGEYVQLNITDTGCGMDEAVQAKIFDPFYSTKGEQGTGLGLSQVYGFMQRSAGVINVHSEPGQGSCFTLYFPRSHRLSKNAKPAVDEAVVSQQGSENLLVVDDEAALLGLAYDILSAQGYHVFTASDGLQALSVLKSQKIELVISDVIMPNMDGFELAAQVQQLYPHIKLLMVSGFTDDRQQNMTDGSLHNNLLSKPYTSKILLQRVRQLLDKTNVKECSQQALEVQFSGRTILVMDDDEDIRELFSINLAMLGYQVIEACDGDEAIDIYQKSLTSQQPIDAIILDLTIPGSMGGKEVAKKIHSLHSQAKIIVSSGSSEADEMINFADYDFSAAIDKNFNREKIKAILEQLFK